MNPMTDPLVHRPYDRESVAERVFNKLWMQDNHGFPLGERIPVFGTAAAYLSPKEMERILKFLPQYLKQGAQLLIAANGAEKRLGVLRQPGVCLMGYTPETRAEVLSSVDFFLEVSGSDREASLAYGAVPVALRSAALEQSWNAYEDEEAWARLQISGMT